MARSRDGCRDDGDSHGSLLRSFTALVGVPYAEAQGIPFMNVINIMLGITAVNGVPEAIVSGLIVTPIIMRFSVPG